MSNEGVSVKPSGTNCCPFGKGRLREGPAWGHGLPEELRVTLVVVKVSGSPQPAGVHLSFVAGTPGRRGSRAPLTRWSWLSGRTAYDLDRSKGACNGGSAHAGP